MYIVDEYDNILLEPPTCLCSFRNVSLGVSLCICIFVSASIYIVYICSYICIFSIFISFLILLICIFVPESITYINSLPTSISSSIRIPASVSLVLSVPVSVSSVVLAAVSVSLDIPVFVSSNSTVALYLYTEFVSRLCLNEFRSQTYHALSMILFAKCFNARFGIICSHCRLMPATKSFSIYCQLEWDKEQQQNHNTHLFYDFLRV